MSFKAGWNSRAQPHYTFWKWSSRGLLEKNNHFLSFPGSAWESVVWRLRLNHRAQTNRCPGRPAWEPEGRAGFKPAPTWDPAVTLHVLTAGGPRGDRRPPTYLKIHVVKSLVLSITSNLPVRLQHLYQRHSDASLKLQRGQIKDLQSSCQFFNISGFPGHKVIADFLWYPNTSVPGHFVQY